MKFVNVNLLTYFEIVFNYIDQLSVEHKRYLCILRKTRDCVVIWFSEAIVRYFSVIAE